MLRRRAALVVDPLMVASETGVSARADVARRARKTPREKRRMPAPASRLAMDGAESFIAPMLPLRSQRVDWVTLCEVGCASLASRDRRPARDIPDEPLAMAR